MADGALRKNGDVCATTAAQVVDFRDLAACAYLALPVLIFTAWFKLPFALVFAGLWIAGMYSLLQGDRQCTGWRLQYFDCVVMWLAISLCALAGVGHLFYANDDWVTRDAVLHDISLTSWPPAYIRYDGVSVILRAPIAYYLPASLVGWLAGVRAAELALYVWTVAGFALFLSLAVAMFKTTIESWVLLAVLLAFGGLDIVGFCAVSGRLPHLGEHLEWWARFAQYSSNTTLLFWVPNHALPGWLATILVLKHWHQPFLTRLAPFLLAVLLLWSPLVAVGISPFLLVGMNWRTVYKGVAGIKPILPWLGLGVVLAQYVTLNTISIPSGWAVNDWPEPQLFWVRYLTFVGVEFGLLAVLLMWLGQASSAFWVAIAVLLLLPLYRFGGANDMVMRGSVPALLVLACTTVSPLLDGRRPAALRGVLLGVVLLGALGSAQEPVRALLRPNWLSKGWTLQEVADHETHGVLPAHYVAVPVHKGLEAMMRRPSVVEASGSREAGGGR
jgi:hypothetical protein